MRQNKALALALTAAADARLWNRQRLAPGELGQGVIRKSGNRFSEKIMLKREILR